MRKADKLCSDGGSCYEERSCTDETCEFNRGWKCTAHHVKHYCAHDFASGPEIEMQNGWTSTCECGMTAIGHSMRYGP